MHVQQIWIVSPHSGFHSPPPPPVIQHVREDTHQLTTNCKALRSPLMVDGACKISSINQIITHAIVKFQIVVMSYGPTRHMRVNVFCFGQIFFCTAKNFSSHTARNCSLSPINGDRPLQIVVWKNIYKKDIYIDNSFLLVYFVDTIIESTGTILNIGQPFFFFIEMKSIQGVLKQVGCFYQPRQRTRLSSFVWAQERDSL